jgi:hypothetical protein
MHKMGAEAKDNDDQYHRNKQQRDPRESGQDRYLSDQPGALEHFIAEIFARVKEGVSNDASVCGSLLEQRYHGETRRCSASCAFGQD